MKALLPALVVAGVLMMSGCQSVPQLSLPLNHASVIREQAAAKGLKPELIAAVIYAETKFEPRRSSAGAEGLMQILPETAQFIARTVSYTHLTLPTKRIV